MLVQSLRRTLVLIAVPVLSLVAHAGEGKTVINVMDYGAMGDGVADDHNAIQAALDDAKIAAARDSGLLSPSGAVVFFPEGVYRVGDTLDLNYSVSIEIVGAGIPAFDVRVGGQTAPYTVPGSPLIYVNGPSTAIIADFKEPKPLFSFTGQVGHSMRNMVLFGCPLGNSAARAHCTALIRTGSKSSSTSGAWGNTLNKYEGLAFVDAVRGVQLGIDSWDLNNDSIVFERIAATNVDTVFDTKTPQSLNLAFRQIGATNCKTVFDFQGGGAVSVDTVSLTGCGGDSAGEWCIKTYGQPNTGVYLFTNVRIETTTEQLLYSDGWGVTELRGVLDARFYAESHPPLIALEGGAVIVTASELVPTTSGGYTGYAPIVEFIEPAAWEPTKRTIRIQNSMLVPAVSANPLLDFIVNPYAVSDSHYRFDGCDSGGNTPWPDLKSAW